MVCIPEHPCAPSTVLVCVRMERSRPGQERLGSWLCLAASLGDSTSMGLVTL